MSQTATIKSLPRAFRMMKSMQAQGIEWGEDYRQAGAQALKEILEGRMAAEIDRHLEEMAARGEADRRNGSYSRWLLSELGDIELAVPRTRTFSALKVVRAYARRAAHVDRMILACFVLGLSTRKVAIALLPILGRRISAATVSAVAKTLDAAVAAFHRRPLGDRYPVLMLDGVVLSRKTGAGALKRPVPIAATRCSGRARLDAGRERCPPNQPPGVDFPIGLPSAYAANAGIDDFRIALTPLLGSSAPGLSASTITRLKEVWGVEAERWQRRDLTAKRYVYFWVDGIYFSARMEEEKQCILVIVGATDKGQKELIAIADGYRESEQSWLEVLLDLKRRGLEMGPQLALGDGALGFWKALRQVYPGAREQRCWVHKTGNVLNKLPKGLQKKAKGRLQDIWMAETRKDAESAFDFFLEAYGPKYDKAAACLAKDRDVLLTFYDFPAEHWKHVRTTNPIESTFATVRLRTYRTKGCLSRKTAMVSTAEQN